MPPSSKAASKPRATVPTSAGAASKRKRNPPAPTPSASTSSSANPKGKSKQLAQTLDLDLDSEDDDDEQDDDFEQGDLAALETDEDDDEDADEFPEIDLGASDQDDQDEDEDEEDDVGEPQNNRANSLRKAAQKDDEDDDDGDDESVELEDSQAGDSDEEEQEGYNSSDIDNLYNSEDEDERASEFAARSDASQTSIEEELSRMVARHSTKPAEAGDSHTNKLGIPLHQAARAFDSTRNPDGSAKGVFQKSKITGEMKRVYPEIQPDYDSDSSTEDPENRIGNVPLEWYDDMPHIGYDINGRKVLKPATKDELEKFLDTVDGDGEAWFSAKDKSTGKDVRLTDEELQIIRKLQSAEIPDDAYDPYEDYVDWYTGPDKVMQTPLTSRPEPKSRFVPSKWEHKKVMKIVRAIREGRITPGAPKKDAKPRYYNIWADSVEQERNPWTLMAAPKLPLPGHAESYNPPEEYLFNEEEEKDWREADPEDRKQNYLPAKHGSLRHVPGYDGFVQERFERCLDLYLAPRMTRKKLDVDNPESLLPKLPSPKELRPFPTATSVVYAHPNSVRVRCISVDPTGQWMVTGADDGRARLWDVAVGRCAASWDLCEGFPKSERSAVHSVAWCPTRNYSLFAATVNGRVAVIAPPQTQNYAKVASGPASSKSRSLSGATPTSTASFLYATAAAATAASSASADASSSSSTTASKAPVKWTRPAETERRKGVAMYVAITSSSAPSLKSIVWHAKGDYFATVATDNAAGAAAVLIHQLTKHRSQSPFRRASKGSTVQKAVFHPVKPWLFVATQRYVRVYDLMAQTLVKTLQTGFKWISSLDVHATGDHLLVGSYDKKLAWFDLDLSAKPFKVLKYHAKAVRSVAFSPAWNLFADASDDGTIQVFYAKVHNDFSQNVTLVPLKILRGHAIHNGLGVLDLKWHPTQPWLLSTGADGNAHLWST
ncbi:BOP1NT-domain-containing protein [Testicularia cyperi]|uniref:Ribosome biogenesis protein ERB1 n=1 Tax=Testicularia cyperi TaxID=1882483 RepID=A0A317XVA3_9BASI|nr:BOP1NT-domain-containing protein [Testicularia cyperi]